MRRLAQSLFVTLAGLCLTSRATAQSIDFRRDVQPILTEHCVKCHGADKRRGGLLLTSRKNALLPSDSGKHPIVPGDAKKSELLRRVLSDDADERMPPGERRLTAAQMGVLRAWIEQGAPWPAEAEARHWAYVKPVRPPLPAVQNQAWPQNPVDYFILARLEAEGLTPAPETDRARLLRRVSLDLIGLPPTVAEVDAFVNDRSPDAYEKAVDRLLASPHYGERWARPWLDLARYADSNGYQRDGFRDVWPYRDWVVAAFNRDLPYDQFTLWQTAGDLLPNATDEQKIATGFHRCTTINVEAGVDREEVRVHAVFDRVNTTATAWLGTTFACAQCHHHKYDPFTQQDYYRLFAYFNNTPIETAETTGAAREFIGPKLALPLPSEQAARRKELTARRATVQRDLQKHLPAEVRKVVAVAEGQRSKKQKQLLAGFDKQAPAAVRKLRQELTGLDKQLAALQPVTSLVMVEMDKPRPTHVLKRGNFLEPGQCVTPGVPDVLPPLSQDAPLNRLALARWLTDPDHPLTARVAVNRWWAELFGQGLVATPEDFGTQGARPTHPELLDWLATEFVRSGWSMKQMHRLMVTSATYRQASRVAPELLAKDPLNKLYARGPRFRLDAETIRDQALAVSGLLSPKLGGPPVRPPQPAGIWNVTGVVDNTYRVSDGDDRYRRGLYTVWRRSSPYPSMVAFDAPDRAACVVQRPRTNTPLQALTLMNDPAYVEAAVALAGRVMAEKPASDARERVVHAFRLCLARQPSAHETELLEQVYRRALQRYRADPAAARALLADYRRPNGAGLELAAWFQVATVLLNLDETITKG